MSDVAAQRVAMLALPEEKPAAFLEIGAGRGTKTILLQSNAQRKYGSQMKHYTLDNHEFKARVLRERAEKYGIEVADALTLDATEMTAEDFPETFDAVFIDAPCSGLGTLRRHPEIRWRLKPEDITSMASINLDLLIEATKMVKPGGVITYATCTVFPEENEQVVERFLKTKFGEQFEIEEQVQTTLTTNGPDAHYAARLRRRA